MLTISDWCKRHLITDTTTIDDLVTLITERYKKAFHDGMKYQQQRTQQALVNVNLPIPNSENP